MEYQSVLNSILDRVSTRDENFKIRVRSKIAGGKAVVSLTIIAEEEDINLNIYSTTVENNSMEIALHEAHLKALTHLVKVGAYSIKEYKWNA